MDNNATMAESGEETTEPIRKQVYEPPGRVGRRFYADVHRLANKNRKRKNDEQHHVYTNDGEGFYRVSRVSEIPAEQGDELYVDTIPVELTDEFIEVLRRGVKVLYLRRLNILAERCEELGLSKTSRNDIRTMMAIEPKWFREVDENFLVMRQLVSDYRGLERRYKGFGEEDDYNGGDNSL
ncbi:MAG: hypothetical protein QW351_04785 [Candidatus Caldarchaeum sp.]